MIQQRMTKQKQLVQQIVQSHHDHPTADQIYLEVRAIDDKISRGTVYRNLEQLSESGVISHVKVPGASRFDYRLDQHYHMICTNCGAVYDIPLVYDDKLDEQAMKKTGFQIDRHQTVFEGLCPLCQKKFSRKKAKK